MLELYCDVLFKRSTMPNYFVQNSRCYDATINQNIEIQLLVFKLMRSMSISRVFQKKSNIKPKNASNLETEDIASNMSGYAKVLLVAAKAQGQVRTSKAK